MATQTKDTKADEKLTADKPDETKPQNVVEAPSDVVREPEAGSWQYALWSVANSLEARGDHATAHLFRAASQISLKKDTKDATKGGK
jgi:hypothetical protein